MKTLGTSARISSFIVAPFVFLEVRYAPQSYSSFPYPLFAMLWLVPAAFCLSIAPLARSVRSGEGVTAHPVTLAVRVSFMALLAVLWMGLVVDQLPCFLGVPNCD